MYTVPYKERERERFLIKLEAQRLKINELGRLYFTPAVKSVTEKINVKY